MGSVVIDPIISTSSSNSAITLNNHGSFELKENVLNFQNNGDFNSGGTLINVVPGENFDGNAINPISDICVVGGESLPIESTALLLAGAQMNAIWILPLIVAAAGIGIVVSRKFWKFLIHSKILKHGISNLGYHFHNGINLMKSSNSLKINRLVAVTLALLISTVSGNVMNAYAGNGGFSGDFDPSNWNFSTEGNGNVGVQTAPDSISLGGSEQGCSFPTLIIDSASRDLNQPDDHIINPTDCLTHFDIIIPGVDACTVNFDWDFRSSDIDGVDEMGYLVNDDLTRLSSGNVANSGSESVPVQGGDLFGFYIDSIDDIDGAAGTTFSEFSVICNGVVEVCDGMDNDGDNMVDEGFNVGQDCEDGVGACFALGNFVCTQDGLGTECDAVQGSPSAEVCDGLDNDCDGSVDDNLMCNGRPPTVGGEFLPIDSTALVLAGLQTSAIWMLPVLAGVAGSAFGILYIKSRRN